MRASTFQKLSICALGYTLLVIVWGAFVRVTGSGAGCGSHWPTCNGEVVPRSAGLETLIEFTHRLTSGLAGLFALALVVAAHVTFPRGHAARRWSWVSLFFMVTEGAVGAGLVLFERVAGDTSTARGYWMSAHLVNTFLLVAAMTVTAAVPTSLPAGEKESAAVRRWVGALPLRPLIAIVAVAFFATGVTGAIAALGDTLFPSDSFVEGARKHLDPSSHVFVRLRILHPFVAVFTALLTLGFAGRVVSSPSARIARHARVVGALVLAQVGVGLVNLLLAAPAAMQLVHLLVGDLAWIAFVVLVTSLATVETEEAGREKNEENRVPAR